MNILTLIAVSLALVSLQAPAATTAEEITAAEVRFQAGLAARDSKALDSLLATPFSWVHASDGRVDDRETWLSSAARGMALSGQRMARSDHGATLQLHGDPAHTAVRIARVRLVDEKHETWMRQTQTWIRNAAGQWQLALGQGVIMYDGPLLDATLHARYAGVYELVDGRRLVLEWRDGSLLATFPNGAHAQVFLSSPTEEIVRNLAVGNLHFTLDEHGAPRGVALVRAGQEAWHATRK
jgi:hypothetical protein